MRPATTESRPGQRSAVARRLVIAFASNLGLFAIAVLLVLRAMGELDVADADVARLDRAKHAGHRAAALVREQYIHQAHTIIEGNRSHLDHYAQIASNARSAIETMVAAAETLEDRILGREILALVTQNDQQFRTETVQAIEDDDLELVRELHAATELTVVNALAGAETLNTRFASRSDAALVRADRLRQRTRWTAIVCFGLSALFAAITGVVTTRSISSRVAALRAAARALGAGDLKRRIRLGGTDEFAEIAAGIDEMAADLERHQERLLRSSRLASIGQVAAGVAHEINNPLGVILGFVKTMRRADARDDEGLDVIEEEANQCKRIVEGLIDLARPQELRLERFDLEALARESVERLKSSAVLDGHELVVSHASVPIVVSADKGRLRQVLLNVLTNAAEAAPRGTPIAVGIAEVDDIATVTVRDAGSGIPDFVRGRLFEPFVTTKRGGLGLGLAIAQSVVEAHHGRIVCEASPSGTEVRISIPVEQGPPSV